MGHPVAAQPLFAVKRAPKISRTDAEAMIVDCTAQPIERPGADAVHRQHVAGKKQQHTIETEYRITEAEHIAIIRISNLYNRHHPSVRQAAPRLPKSVHLHGESGYQGYDNRPVAKVLARRWASA